MAARACVSARPNWTQYSSDGPKPECGFGSFESLKPTFASMRPPVTFATARGPNNPLAEHMNIRNEHSGVSLKC